MSKPTTTKKIKFSKMQDILDKAIDDFDAGRERDAFMQLIEAIKLLSIGLQQNMDSIDRERSRNPFVGGAT